MARNDVYAELATDRTPPLTAFQRDLLFIIWGLDQPKGSTIGRALEQDPSYEAINHGRLYPNLSALQTHGLIHSGRRNLRANWYDLTTNGRAVVDALAKRPERLTQLATDHTATNGTDNADDDTTSTEAQSPQ